MDEGWAVTADSKQMPECQGARTLEPLRTAAGKKKGPTAHGHFRSLAATAD